MSVCTCTLIAEADFGPNAQPADWEQNYHCAVHPGTFPKRPEYVYVASSWRNIVQPVVCATLRAAGIDHYDFKNPPNGAGFGWPEVKTAEAIAVGAHTIAAKGSDWESPDEYLRMVNHPRALEGFHADYAAMVRAYTFVLVLPCGKSASDGRLPSAVAVRSARLARGGGLMAAVSYKVTKARQAAALTRVMREHPPKLRFTEGMRKAALGHGSTRADVAALAGVMALLDRLSAADLSVLDEQALTTALVRIGHVRVASNALRVRIGRALDVVASRERAS